MVAKVTLNAALEPYKAYLGANYENLGRKGNLYLNYTRSKGWAVVDLRGISNLCKRIDLQRHPEKYPTMRLKHIANWLVESDADEILKNKIIASWKRHCMQPFIPLSPVVEPQAKLNPNEKTVISHYIGGTLIAIEEGKLTDTKGVKAIAYGTDIYCSMEGDGKEIRSKAGPAIVQEVQRLPFREPKKHLYTSEAAITRSGALIESGIERVIHAAAPHGFVINGLDSQPELINTYLNVLGLAQLNGIRTIAFSPISADNLGFTFEIAIKRALEGIKGYLNLYPGHFNQIKFVMSPDLCEKAAPIFDRYFEEDPNDRKFEE